MWCCGGRGLTVIFDEAELIARRQGWEAQRWSRHLLAKLQGQDNALPQAINVEANPAMDLAPYPGQICMSMIQRRYPWKYPLMMPSGPQIRYNQ